MKDRWIFVTDQRIYILMPHSEIHQRKAVKNWMIFSLILGWVALIWAVTMIKMAKQEEVCYDNKDGKKIIIDCPVQPASDS
jgi:hypothetical protein